LGLGAVTDLPALNSFFERPQDREPNLAALKDFFDRQPLDGELMVLVTHRVTVTALSGESPAFGTGVLMALERDGVVRAVARIDFDGCVTLCVFVAPPTPATVLFLMLSDALRTISIGVSERTSA